MIPEGTDNSRRSATPSTLPSDAERHGNHARRNPAGVGIVISSLGVELQAGFGEFGFKPRTQASPYSVPRDVTEFLVCLHEGVKEPPKKGSKMKTGTSTGRVNSTVRR